MQAELSEGAVSWGQCSMFFFATEWQFLGAKKESESEVLLHIQLLHLLIK